MINNDAFRDFKFRGKSRRYFHYDIGIPRFSEVDAYNVVWNGHYVNYLETARMALCREAGFDLAKLSEMGFFLPVHRYDVTMRKPILAGEKVTVLVHLEKPTTGVFDFQNLVLVGEEVRAFGMVQHVLVDKKDLSPQYSIVGPVAQTLDQLTGLFAYED